ncbi:MAG: TolC family protein [Desulfotignum sp.]|jgi:outer membrane protein TolC|nr:TolC family protein [Desulfotignum sp.]
MKKSCPFAAHGLLCLILIWLFSGCMLSHLGKTGAADLAPYIPADIQEPIEDTSQFAFTLENPPGPLPMPFKKTADDPLALSLEQAVMMALENNQDLETRLLSPVIAGAFEQMEKAMYDPELFARIGISREMVTESASKETAFITAAGIRRSLPFGTTLAAEAAHGQDQAKGTPDPDKTRVTLSVTQALLQGAGPAGGMVRIRQSELETRASIHELTAFVQALVAETEITYWQFVLARQEHAIVERSLSVSKKQKIDVQHQIDVGVLPRNELAAVQSEVARREQALIDSANKVEAFRLQLLHLLHPGTTDHLAQPVLAVTDPAIDPVPITDMDERSDLALKLRPDLAEARLRMDQNRLETIITHNGMLPRLDFFMDLGIAGFSSRSKDAIQSLGNGDYEVFAGLSVSRFVGNRPGKARHQAAKAGYHQAVEALENLVRTINLDVRLAVNETERARQQITASRITRRYEEQTVAAEIERFNVGAGTALLVAQARRDLLVSQIAEVRAVINYRIARIRLFLAEGSLLQRRGVILQY